MKKIKNNISKIVLYLVLAVSSFTIAFPFLWMISNSIKTKDEIWAMPPEVLPKIPQWIKYLNVLREGDFFNYMWNSTSTAVICTVIVLLNSAMFAYALVFIRFRGSRILYMLILVTYIMPAASTYIPSYILISKMGLMDTHMGYIVSSSASIFNIFYYRTTYLQINSSIMEAAKADGAGHWQRFWRIVMPLSIPATVTLGILSFIGNYNNYLWPSLIIKDKEKYFVSMGLKAFFSGYGAYGMEWGSIMAACCVVVVPLILIVAFGQKWIIKGITSDSGVKE